MKTRIQPSEVIESSKSLFGKHGFKKVTMTDIASAAQISRPTLYTLYPDKDAVFAACILSHIQDFKKEAMVEGRVKTTAHEKLFLLFKIYIVRPYSWYFESDAFDMLVNANLYAPKEMAIYWKDFEDSIRIILDADRKKRATATKDIAKVLGNFARDARTSAKGSRELERLVDTAIQMALAA